LFLLNISLYVINYWFLLEKKFPLNETLRDYFGVWAISLFLPGKIGELGIIPIIKQKYGLPYTTITLSTIIPKFALLGVLLLFFLLGITVIGEFAIAGITLIAILLGMIICWFLRRQFFELFKKIFSNFKTFSFIFKHEMAIRKLFSKENLYIIGLIGITRFFSFFILTYFSYVAFGYSPSIAFLFVAIAISQISVFLPITLNGLGVREATFTGVMVFSGCPLEISLGVLTISLFLNYSLAIILVIFWNTYTKKLNLNAQ
jgi:hypothetical protein